MTNAAPKLTQEVRLLRALVAAEVLLGPERPSAAVRWALALAGQQHGVAPGELALLLLVKALARDEARVALAALDAADADEKGKP